ncbi:N5-glutamine S-adenosyl-L-methionine-dependent methyltransferase [Bacillus sp. TS-2]|nr:N5-glutamine S-adenosyl-L-methionine-dependent methyltransferase [Bacillus sp. TS-2]
MEVLEKKGQKLEEVKKQAHQKEITIEKPAIEWLLRHHLNLSRTNFYLCLQDTLAEDKFRPFLEDFLLYLSGVPIQHIIGYEEFFGRRFAVNSDVLIPRPETEELIVAIQKKVNELFPNQPSELQILDVGTGSGAIAVTLALEIKNSNVLALDISEPALKVAEDNSKKLGATKVQFQKSDLLHSVLEENKSFDIIVSNPPYIPNEQEKQLAVQVREHEPHLALFGGNDGYDLYRRMIKQLPKAIKDKWIIGFEVGAGQTKEVSKLLREAFKHATIECLYDINGKDRIVLAYNQ